MTAWPDPRLHAYRPDLAARTLAGRVTAERFVDGRPRTLAAPAAGLRREPRSDAPFETEALMGEPVTLYDERAGWAWVQLETDGYVGYLPAEALGGRLEPATHRVAVPLTFTYPAPAIKTQPAELLSLNALLRVVETGDGFARLANGRFVHAAHLKPVGDLERDFVSVAESLLGAPYLWGGRRPVGLDCSGLTQLALQAAGIACPRDTDLQHAWLGAARDPRDRSSLRRGDLVFWERHVGIMLDGTRLLHANGHHMRTVIEPLEEAAARIARGHGLVTAIRRLPEPAAPR